MTFSSVMVDHLTEPHATGSLYLLKQFYNFYLLLFIKDTNFFLLCQRSCLKRAFRSFTCLLVYMYLSIKSQYELSYFALFYNVNELVCFTNLRRLFESTKFIFNFFWLPNHSRPFTLVVKGLADLHNGFVILGRRSVHKPCTSLG